MNDYEFYAKKYSHHLAVFETLGNFKKYNDILLAKNKTSSAGVACHRRTRRTSRKRMVNTPKIRHRQRPILRVQVATRVDNSNNNNKKSFVSQNIWM